MRRWVAWLLAATFIVFNYAQQVFPNVVALQLASDLHASKSTLADISAAYFIAYATLQIPIGIVLDRFGVRIPLTLAIFFAGLGSIVFAFAPDAESAIAARLLMGASASFSFLGCLKLVQHWFPASRFSTMAGLTNTAAMLGAASGVPLAIVVAAIGWRSSTAWMGALQIGLAALVLFIVRDRAPSTVQGARHDPPAANAAAPDGKNSGTLLRDPQVWLNAIYATSISLVLVAFGDLWGMGFIEQSYAASATKAADVDSFLFVGAMIGGMFFAWLADVVGSRRKTMILAAAGGVLSIVPTLLGVKVPLPLFEAGLFLVGFFAGASIVSWALAKELYPKSSGLSIGFLSTCYHAGCGLSQPLTGLMLERHSRAAGESTLAAPSLADYRFSFTSLVFFMAVGLLVSFMIKDTRQER